jgi:hypothetical protein
MPRSPRPVARRHQQTEQTKADEGEHRWLGSAVGWQGRFLQDRGGRASYWGWFQFHRNRVTGRRARVVLLGVPVDRVRIRCSAGLVPGELDAGKREGEQYAAGTGWLA